MSLCHFSCSAAGGEPEAGRRLSPAERQAGRFAIANERLNAVLMVPDQPSSPYAGPRYESGGVVMQVTLDGEHTFLGEEGRGDRLGGYGLIEEMGISEAIGYEQAQPGEPFLKLGVGLVTRGKREKYLFYEALPVAQRFPWDVRVGPRWATFVQAGKPFRGIAYRYRKRVVIDEQQPLLRIEHRLTNTGTKRIATDQYCHNYLRFDDAPPGPGYRIEFPFPLVAEGEAKRPMVVEGGTISFAAELEGAAYCRFQGQRPSARGHRFLVRHAGNGLSLEVGGDFPIAYLACYADDRAVSPEAFCAIDVEPGESFRWTRIYAFQGAGPPPRRPEGGP
ncbi:MAG: hypothetical protein ACLF0G_06260 [Candidatus Brocadiia bacterium]